MLRKILFVGFCSLALGAPAAILFGPGATVAMAQTQGDRNRLEMEARSYIARNYRLTVRDSRANQRLTAVNVVAYRPGVGSDRRFQFDVRKNGNRYYLVTPPRALN